MFELLEPLSGLGKVDCQAKLRSSETRCPFPSFEVGNGVDLSCVVFDGGMVDEADNKEGAAGAADCKGDS